MDVSFIGDLIDVRSLFRPIFELEVNYTVLQFANQLHLWGLSHETDVIVPFTYVLRITSNSYIVD